MRFQALSVRQDGRRAAGRGNVFEKPLARILKGQLVDRAGKGRLFNQLAA